LLQLVLGEMDLEDLTNIAFSETGATKLIAEIGNNHLGEVRRAREMLVEALAAGVDAVTFQVREESFYKLPEMTHLDLPLDFFAEAVATTHAAGRQFGIAICDPARIAPLDRLGVDFWKTLSWDFSNEELRAELQTTGKPVYYSTGVSGTDEIVAISERLGNAVLIHTQFSHSLGDVNLKAIQALGSATSLPVAFGLHAHNHEVLKMALCFEPHSLFFYVKQRGIFAYDDEHALVLDELQQTVSSLRELMSAIGTGIKIDKEAPAWVRASK
jgi:sialic acid synthase SpsE